MHRRIRALATMLSFATAAMYFGVGSATVASAASPATAYSISAGFLQTCAVTGPNGAAKCWGRNDYGELGTGTTTSSLTPVGVVGLSSKVAAVSAGGSRSCALTTSGGLKCWGSGPGNGTSGSLTPVSVTGLATGVKAISVGGTIACALTTSGGVRCWGAGSLGQLGDGLLTSSLVPVSPAGLTSGVAAVSTGAQHACVLMSAGGVKCWGWNNYGETGDQTGATTTATPTDVLGLPSNVTGIFVGGYHSCAVTSSGEAWCWGENQAGQLGDGTTLDRAAPAPVSGLSRVTAITGGTYHTCAVDSVGRALCWGNNTWGQLGDGTTTFRYTPVGVSGLSK